MTLAPYLDQSTLAAAWRAGTFAVSAAGRVECTELLVSGAAGVTGDLELSGAILFDGVRWAHDTGHIANAFVGASAGNLSVTGQFNTGLGYNALLALTTGNYNVAVGAGSLDRVTSGANNVAVGYLAGRGTVSNAKVGGVFLGYQAGANEDTSNKLYIHNSASSSPLIYGDFDLATLKINGALESTGHFTLGGRLLKDGVNIYHTSGNESVFAGTYAGNTSNTGTGNIGVGTRTLNAATSADRNVAIGLDSLRYLTTGSSNVCIGAFSGDALTTGGNTTAIGYGSVGACQTGTNNTGIGFNALANTTVGNNTAVGYAAAQGVTTGSGSVAVGVEAMSLCTTGTGNVAIGFQAGKGTATHTTGNSIYIGFQAGMSNVASNRLFIHNSDAAQPLIYGEFDNNLLRIGGKLEMLKTSGYAALTGYFDYSDASNWRRFRIDSGIWAGTVAILCEQAGTPAIPSLLIGAGERLSLAFQSSGTGAGPTSITIEDTGFFPQVNEAMDMGSQSFRFNDIFCHRISGKRTEISDFETPVAGTFVIWQAETAGTKDSVSYAADDICISVTSGAATKTAILFTFSTGTIG